MLRYDPFPHITSSPITAPTTATGAQYRPPMNVYRTPNSRMEPPSTPRLPMRSAMTR